MSMQLSPEGAWKAPKLRLNLMPESVPGALGHARLRVSVTVSSCLVCSLDLLRSASPRNMRLGRGSGGGSAGGG